MQVGIITYEGWWQGSNDALNLITVGVLPL